MILTDTFWPLFAISSLWSGQSTTDGVVMTPSNDCANGRFPGHTMYKLNDGNCIPSPAFGTGSATARTGNATEAVGRALEAGWRHIDASWIYRNQELTGKAIKDSGISRKDLFITSKYDSLSDTPLSPLEELPITLSQLGVSYVDLYLVHFPSAAERGGGIEKVWKEMEDIKRQGLAKSIGISNYDKLDEFEEVLKVAEIKPAINQINYSVYNAVKNAPIVALGAQHGILTAAYGELAPITQHPNGPADKVGKAIAHRLSKEYGKKVTYAQAIFAWLKSTGVVAVTTTSNKERVKEQLVPFGDDFPLVTAAEARAFESSGWEATQDA